MIHKIWIGNQGDPQSLIETVATPVVVAAHQIKLTVEQRNQVFYIFPLAQRQVSNMKDNLFWLNKAVPVIYDRLLPTIRTIAIAADVLVEEMSIRDDIGGFVLKQVYWSFRQVCQGDSLDVLIQRIRVWSRVNDQ
jgi:hypothetical protein